MYFYCILVIFVGIIAGIIIAVCSKKEDGLVYGVLDKVGIVTNIFLIPAFDLVFIDRCSLKWYTKYDMIAYPNTFLR